jgi:CheY-like chemotaxis protein
MVKTNQKISVATSNDAEFKLLKVLIADDNSTIRMILGEMMKEYSRAILFAVSGDEAISIVRDNPDIDLIMMDTDMPGMKGSEAVKKIRQFNSNVVIIIESAFPLSEITHEFAGVAINDYLSKPFNKFCINQLMVKHFHCKDLII